MKNNILNLLYQRYEIRLKKLMTVSCQNAKKKFKDNQYYKNFKYFMKNKSTYEII